MAYIYRTKNLKDNKVYIGQKMGRVKKSYLGSGLYIRRAIEKHGEKNFKLEILAYAKSKKVLDELEKEYIALHRVLCGRQNVYNLTDGGEGSWGLQHKEKTKKRWSKLRKGKNLAGFTSEHFSMMAKKRGAPWNKGLKKEDHPSLLSMSRIKEGKPAYNKGKIGLYKHTESAKRKMKGKHRSPKTEWKKKDPRLMGNTFATGGR